MLVPQIKTGLVMYLIKAWWTGTIWNSPMNYGPLEIIV